ncbi:MAG: hypothetical protein ACOY93_21255 [Bacillota bacterium]
MAQRELTPQEVGTLVSEEGGVVSVVATTAGVRLILSNERWIDAVAVGSHSIGMNYVLESATEEVPEGDHPTTDRR